MESNFEKDLSKEQMLGKYLDGIYPHILKGLNIQRISDDEQQHRGIDLVISHNGKEYYIDEKAQLDYLEIDLPTFAFEITYIKDGEQRLGWVFDKSKLTHKYFAITGIFCNTEKIPESGFKSCKITSVDRARLVNRLKSKGLDYERIMQINQEIRSGTTENRIAVNELDERTEGYFYYSKSGKAEQPINIVLKLDFLIQSEAAKKIV